MLTCANPTDSIWSSTWALDIEGKINWNDVCPSELSYRMLSGAQTQVAFVCVGYEDLGSSKVALDDGRLFGSIMKDGHFVMYARCSLAHVAYD